MDALEERTAGGRPGLAARAGGGELGTAVPQRRWEIHSPGEPAARRWKSARFRLLLERGPIGPTGGRPAAAGLCRPENRTDAGKTAG